MEDRSTAHEKYIVLPDYELVLGDPELGTSAGAQDGA